MKEWHSLITVMVYYLLFRLKTVLLDYKGRVVRLTKSLPRLILVLLLQQQLSTSKTTLIRKVILALG